MTRDRGIHQHSSPQVSMICNKKSTLLVPGCAFSLYASVRLASCPRLVVVNLLAGARYQSACQRPHHARCVQYIIPRALLGRTPLSASEFAVKHEPYVFLIEQIRRTPSLFHIRRLWSSQRPGLPKTCPKASSRGTLPRISTLRPGSVGICGP